MTRRIAIIPARGGSKRIPSKNLADFCGTPLLWRSLTTARDSGLFDTIHVSTDDEAIKRSVESFGLPVEFMRPAELADDHTTLLPVMEWVLAEHARRGATFDVGCLLLPTAPIIDADDLRRGARAHEDDPRRRPALAVARYPAPVEWAFDIDADDVLLARQPELHKIRSQDIRPAYYDTGTFMFFSCASIVEGRHAADGFVALHLPPWKAVDIDEPDDLRLAEILYRGSERQ